MTNDTKNLAELKRDFHKIYYSEIAPIMVEYEKKRKSVFLKIVMVILVMFILIPLLIWGVMLFPIPENLIALIVLALLISFFYCPMYINDLCKDFRKELKNACMGRVLDAFGIMTWYHGESKLSNSRIVKSELFSSFNAQTVDDVFVGMYKSVKFIISECKLSDVTSGGRHSRVHNVFKGVIIDFASNKDISDTTIVSTKGDVDVKNYSLSFITTMLLFVPGIVQDISLWIRIISSIVFGILLVVGICVNLVLKKDSGLNRVTLEDVEFNKHYNVYSSDEIEARYLLTTTFMDRFKNLQTSFGARNAKCSFYGKNIMFAISTNKNIFEFGNVFTPLNRTEHMQTFFNELISILAMIDYFKLNEKSGL